MCIAIPSTLDHVPTVTPAAAAVAVDGVNKGGTSVIENSQVTGTGSSDTSANQSTLPECTLATPTVNCMSNTCSSTPTDRITITVPTTLDGVVVVTACAAGVAVDGVDKGGTTVIENSQVTGSACLKTDANPNTTMRSINIDSVHKRKLLPDSATKTTAPKTHPANIMNMTTKDVASIPHYFTHVESLGIPRKDRVLADKWRIPQGQLKPPPNNFHALVAADDISPHGNVCCGEHYQANVYPRTEQAQLRQPPNNFEASVAANDTPQHGNVWRGECFPAHAYPRTAAAQTSAYNRNVQQPSTKRIITSRSAKKGLNP